MIWIWEFSSTGVTTVDVPARFHLAGSCSDSFHVLTDSVLPESWSFALYHVSFSQLCEICCRPPDSEPGPEMRMAPPLSVGEKIL